MFYLKFILNRCVFRAVLKVLIIAVALILFGSTFQTFAVETIKDRAPHKFLVLCSTRSSLSAKRRLSQAGTCGSTRLHK